MGWLICLIFGHLRGGHVVTDPQSGDMLRICPRCGEYVNINEEDDF